MEEQTKQITATDDYWMSKFLVEFKEELIHAFGDKSDQLEYETGWAYVAGTGGWATAIENASSVTIPYIYKLWKMLDWRDSDGFDNWIIDCAVDHGVIKPMSEDPEFQ